MPFTKKVCANTRGDCPGSLKGDKRMPPTGYVGGIFLDGLWGECILPGVTEAPPGEHILGSIQVILAKFSKQGCSVDAQFRSGLLEIALIFIKNFNDQLFLKIVNRRLQSGTKQGH